ncbi:TPA: DUF3037 domain-containing protein [Citrobacter braakii]|uniref:DUF3037 domain-containing protein n=1 Tax=Citrobacter TaxID=544 RepID=UPI0021E4FF0E|nr:MULTISPECIES: DUF3037 domain-containing protein [Citrobacter]HEB0856982.1 DUF3037 domain-containing protein [Citrobacter freundii]MDM3310700.1 DUF3037 domain-containing protein [Citrobacter sp. Cb223]MEB0958077.1 DUF3037 domain-containing protein [Citrobacter braakii]MEB0987881.1 DUF3037 domain-containing protein [Citrobacter braakii]WOU46050.1 DUF3037 domain-containing protein [Citrobacter portucalensis]
MTIYNYSIIRITPNPVRAESINIGLIVSTPGGPDIRVLETFSKIKAITKSFSMENLDALKSKMEFLLTEKLTLDEAVKFFQGSINLSEAGTFTANTPLEYESNVELINKTYITPEKSSKKEPISQKRIITELKNQFSHYGIMGKGFDDLNDHKVVQGYPLSTQQGLYAELLLKNGAYHLTETLDFRTANSKQKVGDSAFKAITMSTAKNILDGKVNALLVYAADLSQERMFSQQLALVNNYADKTFNLLSNEDMSHYFEHMLNAAGIAA